EAYAYVYSVMESPDAAIAWCSRAIRLEPDDADLLCARGNAWVLKERLSYGSTNALPVAPPLLAPPDEPPDRFGDLRQTTKTVKVDDPDGDLLGRAVVVPRFRLVAVPAGPFFLRDVPPEYLPNESASLHRALADYEAALRVDPGEVYAYMSRARL